MPKKSNTENIEPKSSDKLKLSGVSKANEALRQTERALERFIPKQLLKLMGAKDIRHIGLGAQSELDLAVLFADIREFTSLSEALSPQENFDFLNSYTSQMQPVISKNHGIVDKYVGDAIMALFPTGPADALAAAIEMIDQLETYNCGRDRAGYRRIRIGIGINYGRAMLGTIGSDERMDATVIGDSVNLASRIERATRDWDADILASGDAIEAVKDKRRFNSRLLEMRLARGKSKPVGLFEVFDADNETVRAQKILSKSLFTNAASLAISGKHRDAAEILEDALRLAPLDKQARILLERCRRLQQEAILQI